MKEPQTKSISILQRLWNFLTKGWVATVPDELAGCEFNCRVSQCDRGRWESCEHRRRYSAGSRRANARTVDIAD